METGPQRSSSTVSTVTPTSQPKNKLLYLAGIFAVLIIFGVIYFAFLGGDSYSCTWSIDPSVTCAMSNVKVNSNGTLTAIVSFGGSDSKLIKLVYFGCGVNQVLYNDTLVKASTAFFNDTNLNYTQYTGPVKVSARCSDFPTGAPVGSQVDGQLSLIYYDSGESGGNNEISVPPVAFSVKVS